MASITASPPLGSPMQYDPSFKVDVFLHEPLWSLGVTPNKIALEAMSLCAQLDMLCVKELSQHQIGRIDHGKVSNSFETKAMVLLDRLTTLLMKLSGPNTLPEEYLDYTGLAKLYPRAAAYVTRPKDLSLAYKATAMDDYFTTLGNVQQLVSLAHQINSDVTALENHKYVAHQLALLYQGLHSLGDKAKAFIAIKETIEENFKVIKNWLSDCEQNNETPMLNSEQVQWVLDITSELVKTATTYPKEISKDMFQPALLLSQLSNPVSTTH